MKRAVLYLRVSSTDQTAASQERELREIAERAGWEVLKVYRDHGISGAKGREINGRLSTRFAVTPAQGSSMSLWVGRSIVSAAACKT
jgi:hypothetical protein